MERIAASGVTMEANDCRSIEERCEKVACALRAVTLQHF